ncbi:hypothetical protein Pla52o_22300 [Novipirellula galeiformis]|uniref:BON domain protein n=1 Tax=Novipirellula galeiformis TaxID=2528004 RepID=A0A5C6CHC1_9BACT|nr:hypothetical protein Pla52o_22300 [Novipirellula galeiformis]
MGIEMIATEKRHVPEEQTCVPSQAILRSATGDIQAAISRCAYTPVKRLTCGVQGRVLIVCGRLPSFFLKQIAIELVRPHQSVEIQCEFAIEVD